MSNSIQVRELDNLQDQDFGRNIFDITWSMDAGTEITPNLLQAMVHSGSYLSGAFIDNKIVGAAFAVVAGYRRFDNESTAPIRFRNVLFKIHADS